MLSNQWLNILIVGIYFVFLIVIGWIFRTFSSNTSDYFKGGGKMLWWMVGSTAFMTQFSAWSFTGAAGKAFSNGLSVMMIFSVMLWDIFSIISFLPPNRGKCGW